MNRRKSKLYKYISLNQWFWCVHCIHPFGVSYHHFLQRRWIMRSWTFWIAWPPLKKWMNSVLRFTEEKKQKKPTPTNFIFPLTPATGAQTGRTPDFTPAGRNDISTKVRAEDGEQSDITQPSEGCGYPGEGFVKIATKWTPEKSLTIGPLIIQPPFNGAILSSHM